MAAGSLITTYFTAKYISNSREKSKLLTWQSDKNWEDRFFNLYQDKGITLQYIRIIIDNFASTMLNECIKNFKREKEEKEKDPSYVEVKEKVL